MRGKSKRPMYKHKPLPKDYSLSFSDFFFLELLAATIPTQMNGNPNISNTIITGQAIANTPTNINAPSRIINPKIAYQIAFNNAIIKPPLI